MKRGVCTTSNTAFPRALQLTLPRDITEIYIVSDTLQRNFKIGEGYIQMTIAFYSITYGMALAMYRLYVINNLLILFIQN